MLAGNLLALFQTNIKRLLAYSSIAHFGYLLVAFLSAGPYRITAVTFYLVAYFVTMLGAFSVMTALSGHREGRGQDRGLRRPFLHPPVAGRRVCVPVAVACRDAADCRVHREDIHSGRGGRFRAAAARGSVDRRQRDKPVLLPPGDRRAIPQAGSSPIRAARAPGRADHDCGAVRTTCLVGDISRAGAVCDRSYKTDCAVTMSITAHRDGPAAGPCLDGRRRAHPLPAGLCHPQDPTLLISDCYPVAAV